MLISHVLLPEYHRSDLDNFGLSILLQRDYYPDDVLSSDSERPNEYPVIFLAKDQIRVWGGGGCGNDDSLVSFRASVDIWGMFNLI